jgi:hypothetical protein
MVVAPKRVVAFRSSGKFSGRINYDTLPDYSFIYAPL